MTLQNQHSSRAQEAISPSGLHPPALPAVEWTPLDELIQGWATFAHATTNPVGLAAASAAFAALAVETTARHVAAFTGGLGAGRLPDSVYVDLDEACDYWLLALGHLSSEGQERDETGPLLADLGRLSMQHQQSLFALSVRLWQEQAPLPIQGHRRLMYGPLALPDCSEPQNAATPEQEPAGAEEEAQPC